MSYDYPEQELVDSIRRAFVGGRCDYIVIYDRRQRFLLQSASLGVDRGWLTSKVHDLDEQSTEWRYRLTPAGRQYFGVPSDSGGDGHGR